MFSVRFPSHNADSSQRWQTQNEALGRESEELTKLMGVRCSKQRTDHSAKPNCRYRSAGDAFVSLALFNERADGVVIVLQGVYESTDGGEKVFRAVEFHPQRLRREGDVGRQVLKAHAH